jgi:hypothetical protein
MQSRLVTRKNEIESELRRGVRDPARKRHLTARLLQIENDIRAMGFSEEEIENNDFADGGKTISGRQFLMPLPEWTH